MKIAIIGYGKMGKTIERLAIAQGHQVTAVVDGPEDPFWTTNFSKTTDVAIEFTHPESGYENIKRCLTGGLAVVSGTTGWLDQMGVIHKICEERNGAFFYASNFSVGVNILFEINSRLAAIMNKYPGYEVQIEEIHHTEKKDAPSGTAITLANGVIEQLNRKKRWINDDADHNPENLNILSKRINHTPGTHIVEYQSAIDAIEIKHTAHSREGFALGALMAAQWLKGKKGSFGMKDLLGSGA